MVMKNNVIKFLGFMGLISVFPFIIFAVVNEKNPNNTITYLFVLSSLCTLVGFLSLVVFGLVGHKCGKYISKCCCDMGWHKPIDIKHVEGDPYKFIEEAQCEYCGYKGLIDSNGDLF